MTTMTKQQKKTIKERIDKKEALPPLPPTAKVVEIGGCDCVIVPLAEYDDWLQDAMLAAIGADRLKNQRGDFVPFDEAVARLDSQKKKR